VNVSLKLSNHIKSLFPTSSKNAFLPYFLIALFIAAITSYTNFGHTTGDEYSQIFEFAAHKLGNVSQGDLRYEFNTQMRPSVQAWAVVAAHRVGGLITNGINPFYVNYVINFLSGAFCIFSIIIFTKAFLPRIEPRYQKYFLILSLFSWLVLYTNVHFNSENISGHLLLLAVGLLYPRISKLGAGWAIGIGAILGLAFSCRFQIGFAILGLMLWLLVYDFRAKKIGSWFLLALGMAFSILIFNIVADYYFYGNLVFTTYNYFYQNIVTGMMNRDAGVSPWFTYFITISFYFPFGPLYVIAAIYYFIKYPRDLITSIVGFFVLIHMVIGHKEARFLLPMLGFAPAMIFVTLQDWEQRYSSLRLHSEKIIKAVWIVNIIACVTLLIPAATDIGAWRFLHNHYTKPTVLYYHASPNQKLLYYKKSNLELVKYNSGDATPLRPGYNCLIAFDANSRESQPSLPLVYSFFPPFLEANLPAFIKRSVGHFNIYELQNVEAD
jgi:phosphatidylinositol glycan class B